MCGRINVIDSPGLQQLLKDLGIDLSLPSRANLAPTEFIPLLTQRHGAREVEEARWWLTPSWAPAVEQKFSMFNARSEGLVKSRAFSRPFKSQRGLVPVSSFIEWRMEEGVKQPWLISNEQGAMTLAALWDVWTKGEEPLLSCTLVTTAAAPAFREWHDRMPVMLAAEEWDRWLDNSSAIPADDPIFQSELKQPIQLSRLPRSISNSRNKEPALMAGEGEPVCLAG